MTVIGSLFMLSQAAMAADGTITFIGNISDTSCTVTGGGAAKGTGSITVNMPTVSTKALASTGQTAGDTPFSLILGGAECTNGKTAALWVETTATPALDSATGALKNQQSGGAANVAVRLINAANNDPINLGINAAVALNDKVITANNQPAATIAEHAATLNYVAQYLAIGAAAGPGKVSTYLTYSMQYN